MISGLLDILFNRVHVPVKFDNERPKCESLVENPFSKEPKFASSFSGYAGVPHYMRLTPLGRYEIEIMCAKSDEKDMLEVYSHISENMEYTTGKYWLGEFIPHYPNKIPEGFENAVYPRCYLEGMRYHGTLPINSETGFLVDYLRIHSTIITQYQEEMQNCHASLPTRLKLPWVDYYECTQVEEDPDSRRNWFRTKYSTEQISVMECKRFGDTWTVYNARYNKTVNFSSADTACSYIMGFVYQSRSRGEAIDDSCNEMLCISIGHYEKWLHERLQTMRDTPNATKFKEVIVYTKSGE